MRRLRKKREPFTQGPSFDTIRGWFANVPSIVGSAQKGSSFSADIHVDKERGGFVESLFGARHGTIDGPDVTVTIPFKVAQHLYAQGTGHSPHKGFVWAGDGRPYDDETKAAYRAWLAELGRALNIMPGTPLPRLNPFEEN